MMKNRMEVTAYTWEKEFSELDGDVLCGIFPALTSSHLRSLKQTVYFFQINVASDSWKCFP